MLSFSDSLADAEARAVERFRDGSWNPGSPNTATALELQQAVQVSLRLTPMRRVELVNALGTTMDAHWGVDGYFRLAGTEVPIIVTFDLTKNQDKIRLGPRKAGTDFFLTPTDFSTDQALNAFGHKVAHLLRKRYKEIHHGGR